MAEAAGLAIGGIGLAALVTTSVECLDYITLAKHSEAPRLREAWPEIGDIVGNSLLGMQRCFSEQKTLESRYGLRPALESSSWTSSLAFNSSRQAMPSSLAEIEASFDIIARRRQRATTLPKKIP
jgi:hypothetical protein